jgi:hypothetical protein
MKFRLQKTPQSAVPSETRSTLIEHMFQSSINRLRALLTLADDLLGDPPAPESHPHRRPVRIVRARRPGSVAPRAMHCLSPVRPASQDARRDRVS